MADNTPIEWTDASWSPIRARYFEIQNDGSGKERIGWHCEHVTEGCRNCYAERLNIRLGTGRDFKPAELYREEHEGYRNGEVKLFLDEKMLQQPLRWRQPRRIFVCSMTDLFAAFVPDEWIDRVFAVMALCPQHTFQVLTKRAQRMRDYLSTKHRMGDADICRAINLIPAPLGNRHGALEMPLPNVWLGVSVEDQTRADERIPLLLDTPAAKRFISVEPLLGPVDLDEYFDDYSRGLTARTRAQQIQDGTVYLDAPRNGIDWVIVGGESGPGARPMHPDWARSLRDQCQAAGVAFFLKQWGEWHPCESHEENGPCYPMPGHAPFDSWKAPMFDDDRTPGWHWRRLGKKAAGRMMDGREWNEFPDRHSPDAGDDGTARAHR